MGKDACDQAFFSNGDVTDVYCVDFYSVTKRIRLAGEIKTWCNLQQKREFGDWQAVFQDDRLV